MAGLTPQSPQPTTITAHQQSRVLEVGFSDGSEFRIPYELMRVYSPSAEVQGHGPGQEELQHAELWQKYEARLHAAGKSRDAPMVAEATAGGSCGHHH